MFYLASPSPERRAASCWRCACRARPSSDRSNRRSPSTQPRSRQRPPRVSPRSCGRRAPILARQRHYRRRRKPKRKGTDGFVPWTEADMTAYEALANRHAPKGLARLAGLYRFAPGRCCTTRGLGDPRERLVASSLDHAEKDILALATCGRRKLEPCRGFTITSEQPRHRTA